MQRSREGGMGRRWWPATLRTSIPSNGSIVASPAAGLKFIVPAQQRLRDSGLAFLRDSSDKVANRSHRCCCCSFVGGWRMWLVDRRSDPRHGPLRRSATCGQQRFTRRWHGTIQAVSSLFWRSPSRRRRFYPLSTDENSGVRRGSAIRDRVECNSLKWLSGGRNPYAEY